MRPLRLDLDGFGTFRDPVSLDFSDTDYFALVGPTGSGKTTVIDGICFALYGSVPRWPRSGQVSLAMAPSTSHTRVSLIFEVAGRRYAAVRALAKSARNQVTTKQSRLISLSTELDLTAELGELLDAEVESIAESPADLKTAVEDLLGLTYEHFTQSVVLPQGGFARFLHAEKRERQDLLVSLLGLGVYERVKQRANAVAAESKTRAATLSEELIKYADATEAAEQTAAADVDRLTAVQTGLAEELAPWLAAVADLKAAAETSSVQEASRSALAAVDAPEGLESLGTQRSEATAARDQAAERVTGSEHAEVAAEQAAEAAGQPSDWHELVRLHDQLHKLTEQRTAASKAVDQAAASAGAAATEHADAEQQLTEARDALDQVRIAHAADDLATVLRAGSECPVCRQPVSTVPDRPAHPGLDQASTQVRRAEQAEDRADRQHREAQRRHDRALTELDRLATESVVAQDQLAGGPDAAAVAAGLNAARLAETALRTAREEARKARETHRRLAQAAQALEQRWIDAGRLLTQQRDGLATLSPPATTGDHVQDWLILIDWAQELIKELDAKVSEARARREAAVAAEQHQRAVITESFGANKITIPSAFTETGLATAVATAVTSAQHRLDRITERRREAAELDQEIKNQTDAERLNRELGTLLSAANFERWMVEEALQAMMIEASTTLAELSGGQFELTLDDRQDILVIDHNDASSTRPVQTLSGGETFQASLALALALSSQLAALSTGAGRLDTILLDEGFGTLDQSTLDVVAGTLEQLAGGGERTVGVVTHVAALAERVPVRFEVRREGSRSSVQKVWA